MLPYTIIFYELASPKHFLHEMNYREVAYIAIYSVPALIIVYPLAAMYVLSSYNVRVLSNSQLASSGTDR